MAVPCQSSPQESLGGFEKFFLHWVQMNSLQCWKAKLDSALFFRVQSGKMIVCLPKGNLTYFNYKSYKTIGLWLELHTLTPAFTYRYGDTIKEIHLLKWINFLHKSANYYFLRQNVYSEVQSTYVVKVRKSGLNGHHKLE